MEKTNNSVIRTEVRTKYNDEFINITEVARQAVKNSGIQEGTVTVFVPHTTAGVTINENADPDVVHDMLLGLGKAYPRSSAYLHCEGNSHAHLKATAVGASETIIISQGKLLLGTWQGIYFCEFDGPRNRSLLIKIIEG